MATVTLKIDGRTVTVPKGTNLIEAGKQAGVFTPHFCYHPGLPVVGVCRICLVEIEGRPKLVAGCATPAEEGMSVVTRSAKVKEARRAVMEFLLIHHPLDCPMCDKGGECTLQDYTVAMGPPASRFQFEKNTWPEEDVGGKLILNKNRCILCMRCVNLCIEVAGVEEIAVMARGEESYIGTVGGKKIENELVGNIADICPVGALTSKDFRFKSRPWELKNSPSVCTLCSKGCNTIVGFHPRRREVLRFTARENMDVNQWWICDRGRGQFHSIHSPDRLTAPSRRANGAARAATWQEAIPAIASALKGVIARGGPEAVGVVASAELTNEELYLARATFRDALGIANFDAPARPQPPVVYAKFTIEGDMNPNTRGARAIGVAPGPGGLSVEAMMQAAADGKIRALVFLRGGPLETFGDPGLVARALDRAELVVVLDTHASPVAEKAHWVLSGSTQVEKDGTYTNSRGRVQRVHRVFSIAPDVREDWRVIQDLGLALGALHERASEAEQVFARLAGAVPAFAGLTYASVGDQGAPLASATADVAVG
ncbi:MAG TPA: molybdopterin-dependent oxidoreductase [Candidatus Eisenbacteria bacterium]|nr:molybdopterin-dependent oxidoreductase [Candidatus Eisenbacteria bacterium]